MLIIPMLNQIGNQPPSNFKIRKFGKLHDFGNFAKIFKSLTTAVVMVNFVTNEIFLLTPLEILKVIYRRQSRIS